LARSRKALAEYIKTAFPLPTTSIGGPGRRASGTLDKKYSPPKGKPDVSFESSFTVTGTSIRSDWGVRSRL